MTMASLARADPDGAPQTPGWAVAVWVVAVLDTAFVAVAVILQVLGPPISAVESVSLLATVTIVALVGIVGSILSTRVAGNRVGWLLWLASVLMTISIAGGAYGSMSWGIFEGTLPATELVLLASNGAFAPAIGLIVIFIPLYFPNGELPSARWRYVAWWAAFGLVLLAIRDSGGAEQWTALLDVVNVIFVATAFPLVVAAAVLRFRRGTSIERQQLKWFAAAVAIAALGFGIATILPPPWSEATFLIGLLGLTLLPIAIGVAILRYRLFEIDRIISRTISWALVTGTLAAAFSALVIGLTALLGNIAGGSTFVVAGSTLIVFALFQPLRTRIQRVVDRRFDRARYDAERTAAAFATRLRDDVDLTSIQGDLLGVVHSSLQPASMVVWTRDQSDHLR